MAIAIRRRLRRDARLASAVRLNASFVLWRLAHEILYSKPVTDGTEETQRLTHAIARTLCNLPPLSWVADYAKQRRQEIDDEAGKLREHHLVRSILDQLIVANYWAASYFAFLGEKMSPDTRRALDEYELLRARSPNMAPASEAELKRIGLEFARRATDLQKAEHHRTAYKFPIGLSELSQIVAILSPVLLVAGFVYCHVYYGHFGISTGNYFNLSDYLASSIEAIYAAGISAAVSGIGLIVNIRRDSVLRPLQRPVQPGISRSEVPVLLALGFSLVGEIEALVSGNPESWLILSVFIYVLLLYFVTSQLPRLFTKPLAPVLLTLFISSFFTTLVCHAEYSARVAAQGSRNVRSPEELVDKDGHRLTTPNQVVIGANSNYFFLWNGRNRIATALPRATVAVVRIAD